MSTSYHSMCTAAVPHLLLSLITLGFQVVSGYTAAGACLQGFIGDIPEENTLTAYSRLKNNEDSTKIFLFPSTAFLCNGTLHELEIPYVVDRSDNLVWHKQLTANMSVWRPTTTGYTEVVRFQLFVNLPNVNGEPLYVASRTLSDTIVAQPLNLTTVHRGDIIGVTLSPKVNTEYIPMLMRSSGSEGGKREGCGDINTTHNCNIIRDEMPLIAANVTILQGDTLSNATGGRITPTATSLCACSHDVSEVTRLSTVYINVCSKVDTTVPHQPRQPPILTTATYTKSDSTSTVSTVISTMSHQGSTASLDSIISTQPKPTTHSLHNLQPTPVPSLENTIRDPHHTGSPETESVERADSVREGSLVITSAVLGVTVAALLIVSVTLSVLVALLAVKVKHLKVAKNMQGFVKASNAYIDIEQKEKHPETKDTEEC